MAHPQDPSDSSFISADLHELVSSPSQDAHSSGSNGAQTVRARPRDDDHAYDYNYDNDYDRMSYYDNGNDYMRARQRGGTGWPRDAATMTEGSFRSSLPHVPAPAHSIYPTPPPFPSSRHSRSSFLVQSQPSQQHYPYSPNPYNQHPSYYTPSSHGQSYAYVPSLTYDSEPQPEAEWQMPVASVSPPRKEFFEKGGDYFHGVGYEQTSTIRPYKRESQEVIDKRMKKLEKEFGEIATGGGGGAAMSMKDRVAKVQEMQKREKIRLEELTGVDESGRIVVHGKRKRTTLRCFQALLAIGVGFGSIGSGIFTHPTTTPPQSHKIPLYALYILPFLSLFLTIYLFLIKPCLTRSQYSRQTRNGQNGIIVGGGGGDTGGGGCCGGRKKPQGQGQQQIQLTIDPKMFAIVGEQRNRERERDRERRRKKKKKKSKVATRPSDDADEGHQSDSSLASLASQSSSTSSSDNVDEGEEEGPTSNLPAPEIERRWMAGRSFLKLILGLDFLLTLVWLFVPFWALFSSGACKPGDYQGWCDYYNVAIALAVLLAVSFAATLGFGIVDLRRSRVPPRFRGLGGGGRRRGAEIV